MSTCFDNGQRCVLVDNGYGDECMYCGNKPQETKMGCDIHVYRERRVNGVWETDTTRECESEPGASDPYYSYESGVGYVSRCYPMFAALSGVREYDRIRRIQPPAEDRGFPEDAAETHKLCSEQWDSDGHSHGWLDMAELDALIEEYFQAPVLHEGSEYFEYAHASLVDLRTQAYSKGYFDGLAPEDCRILFFYDN
ncbi:hypothetical protein Erwinia_phage_Pastis_00016 [Erwinia phage Pastis]|nr:hypothetical protein Erwinia_phage_Pastis_00016 [Erwinia phage Pastis]